MNFETFKCNNESSDKYENDILTLYSPDKTDYFNSPVKENGAFPEAVYNAPLFYTEMTGDFVFRTKVSLEFKNTYDKSWI